MKRYLLFCFDNYYPTGGWNDQKGSFDSLAELGIIFHTNFRGYDSFQVIDTHCNHPLDCVVAEDERELDFIVAEEINNKQN